MSPVSFLIALAGLSLGTYLMRFAGVKLGGALATKGRSRQPATDADETAASAGEGSAPTSAKVSSNATVTDANGSTTSAGEGEGSAVGDPGASTERVTMWMDRATVVLIGAVFATTAIFDGKDIADPARLIGVGAGVLAAIVRVPMLLSVVIGMGVCALIRTTGIL
jgi:uncharacterized membrane protein